MASGGESVERRRRLPARAAVAWDREQNARSAGLRTFPLVAVASCGYILLARSVFGHDADANAEARIVQGLMTGIGFIGGGAILKHGVSVRGTATAASVWNTGAIGACAAYGRYEIAVILSLINFLTFRFLTELKNSSDEPRQRAPTVTRERAVG